MKTNSYKKIIIIASALIMAFQGWSYTVKGLVMAEDKPIHGIKIKISDNDGKELGVATTDDKGKFIIADVDNDKITVSATGDGYLPFNIVVVTGSVDTDLGKLNLDKTIGLDEVVVTAKSRVNTPGKTIIYVSPEEKERAASPFNMLSILAFKAPQILVRESERTLTIGGEEPEILVNGIKRPMSFISSIKPDAIQKIEFSNSEDIRFGKRYLNIITSHSAEGGWLMADWTGAITTPRYFISGVAEYTKGKNDFMIFYNGNYRHGRKEYFDEVEKYIGGSKEITLGVKGRPSSTLDRTHNLNLYFTRMPSDRSMFVATGSLNVRDNDMTINGTVSEADRTYSRVNNRGYKSLSPVLSVYYSLQASATAGIEVNAVGSYRDQDTHRNLSYSTGYDSRLSSKSSVWYFSAETIWKQRLPFASLNTGISASYSDASTKYIIDGTESRNPLSSTRLKAYTSLNGNIFSIGYSLGAGVTYYKVDKEFITPDITASLYKSFGSDVSLSYNFRYTPGMPPVANYNEVATPVNEFMCHIGTADQKSQRNISNQLQIELNKNKFYISLKGNVFNTSRPLVTDYIYQNVPNLPFYGFFLEKPGNGRSFLSYGVDCNAGVSNLWNFLSFRISTGWGHNKLKTSESFTKCTWYLDMGMGMYWKGWQLNLAAENLVPAWSMSGMDNKVRRWPYTSLAVYKKFGNWNLHLAWSNLFCRYGGRYRTERLSSVAPRSSEYRMNDQGNLLEIGVRYQFSTGKLMNKKRRSINLSGKGEDGVRWEY